MQVQDMSASAAKALALEILSQWPLFGSSFFAVSAGLLPHQLI
jgi:hypothetical protein